MSISVFTVDPTGGASILHNGGLISVPSDHPKFRQIVDLLRIRDFDNAIALMDTRTAVRQWINDHPRLELRNDRLHLDGEQFSDLITDKALNMIERGNSAQPLVNFLTNVRNNPSATAQNELLLFCEANDFMIDETGCIVAYKSVRGNYTDIHSGKFDNSVGTVNSMPRRTVDDRRDVTCSYGLHFASHQYASTWAGAIDGRNLRLMVIRVNPADVVSIPNDYGNQKGRCCRYEVVGEMKSTNPLPPREVYTEDQIQSPPVDSGWDGNIDDFGDEDPWNDGFDGDIDPWDDDEEWSDEYIADYFGPGRHYVVDYDEIDADYIVVTRSERVERFTGREARLDSFDFAEDYDLV
jgi:hypothetical protein